MTRVFINVPDKKSVLRDITEAKITDNCFRFVRDDENDFFCCKNFLLFNSSEMCCFPIQSSLLDLLFRVLRNNIRPVYLQVNDQRNSQSGRLMSLGFLPMREFCDKYRLYNIVRTNVNFNDEVVADYYFERLTNNMYNLFECRGETECLVDELPGSPVTSP